MVDHLGVIWSYLKFNMFFQMFFDFQGQEAMAFEGREEKGEGRAWSWKNLNTKGVALQLGRSTSAVFVQSNSLPLTGANTISATVRDTKRVAKFISASSIFEWFRRLRTNCWLSPKMARSLLAIRTPKLRSEKGRVPKFTADFFRRHYAQVKHKLLIQKQCIQYVISSVISQDIFNIRTKSTIANREWPSKKIFSCQIQEQLRKKKGTSCFWHSW